MFSTSLSRDFPHVRHVPGPKDPFLLRTKMAPDPGNDCRVMRSAQGPVGRAPEAEPVRSSVTHRGQHPAQGLPQPEQHYSTQRLPS